MKAKAKQRLGRLLSVLFGGGIVLQVGACTQVRGGDSLGELQQTLVRDITFFVLDAMVVQAVR